MKDKISILIVEDDMIIAANISLQLNTLGYEVLGIVTRGEAALEYVVGTPPDILLMDINLKGKMDGIETARAIQETKDIPLIYLTANTDEATFAKAKSTKPRAFIAKPFNKLNLHRTVELVADQLNTERPSATTPVPELKVMDDRIFIRRHGRMQKLLLDHIHYIVADRNYCCLTTKSGDFVLCHSLKTIQEHLPPSQFIRVHRSYMVNIKSLDSIADDHLVIDKKTIPLSKSYKALLYDRIQTI
ncbi:response regulator [Pseudozobellia thermophila]|uniref:Two component transcriptional regulator, LytTR family n=1 Tax=Pseudozobellia thermophila TaxID=192903 RepID=A0A1M6HD53_9FLAO|nr:response regulator [Pseudozobellia thermophila]SHJ20147.1 two component transcriptional regulator, LytTR family [Pseudozobellia thermophila]